MEPNTNAGGKLPFGVLIGAGILVAICELVFPCILVARLASRSAESAVPTIDARAIDTAAFETAVQANLATLRAQATPSPLATATPARTGTPTPIRLASFNIAEAACIPDKPAQTGEVVQVVDGDTIHVRLYEDGKEYPVRYIGIDAPESGWAYAAESTAKNRELVDGKTVVLFRDVTDTDIYDRLLRYVIVGETFVNYELVADGAARSYRYRPDTSCNSTFDAAQSRASTTSFGLWALPPTLIALPTASRSGEVIPCPCSGPDLDCADFGTHSKAQACYEYCLSIGRGDVYRLDREADGNACETLP